MFSVSLCRANLVLLSFCLTTSFNVNCIVDLLVVNYFINMYTFFNLIFVKVCLLGIEQG